MLLKNPSLDYFKLGVTANANKILVTHENPQGVGVLFLLAIPKIATKNPHPPGGFGEKPLYTAFLKTLCFKFFRNFSTGAPNFVTTVKLWYFFFIWVLSE